MAIPPPPPGPPGPPPPPMGGLKLSAPSFGKSSGSGDQRSALLSSIQKGTKLKKTTTVDKSGPAISGRVSDTNSRTGAPSRPPPPNGSAQINGTPKLGGIFEGVGMPKLKPVGGRTPGVMSPSSDSPASASTGNSPQNTSTSNSNGSALDFSTELAQRLNRKKMHAEQPTSNANSDINRNRGPPPQPPSKSVTDNNSSPATANSSPLIKQSSGSPVSSNGSYNSILPNKSALYGNGNSNSINANSIATKMTATAHKPNHGKPFCAPKPPGIQQLTKNGLSPLTNVNSPQNNGNSNRSIVSRTQSMRSPRSPPIAVASPAFPAQPFGTIRGAPGVFQSQDGINLRPAPVARPTVAPPKPPTENKATTVKEQAPRPVIQEKRPQGRTKSPPPPPTRSVSNTNLPTLALSVSPAAITPQLNSVSSVNTTNFGGSASNVSTLINTISNTGSANSLSKDRSPNTSTTNIAPPIPKHRHNPAPPPPIRQTSIPAQSNNSGAPPVPRRDSSMRNSNGAQATVHQTIVTTVTPNSTRSVARLVVDIDAKFGHTFHNVTEFPAPSPYTKFEKSFPSRRNMMAPTETRKAKAPSPPSIKATNDAATNDKLYLLSQDEKFYTNESSYC